MPIKTGLFLIAVLLATCGCYTFQPASVESLPTGSRVRARLSPDGTAGLTALTGQATDEVEGSVVRTEPDTVVLEVWRNDLRSGRVFAPGRLRLPLPRRHILDVAEKRLSYLRTGAVSAVLAVGAYQIFRLLADDAGGTSTVGPDPGGPSIFRR